MKLNTVFPDPPLTVKNVKTLIPLKLIDYAAKVIIVSQTPNFYEYFALFTSYPI